jgi:predicted O-methyltransferase YrrM
MDIQNFLIQLKKHGIKNDIPNISEENAQYLCSILSQLQAKEVLEVGTANGYSTIHFAHTIQAWWGQITTIEFSSLSHETAKKNFAEVELTNIQPLLGNALDIIPKLETTYDFIFIDGMKRRSRDFLELCIPKIKKWGIIVIDDVIKFREKMVGLYEFLEDKNIVFELIQIDADDGIMIIHEKDILRALLAI